MPQPTWWKPPSETLHSGHRKAPGPRRGHSALHRYPMGRKAAFPMTMRVSLQDSAYRVSFPHSLQVVKMPLPSRSGLHCEAAGPPKNRIFQWRNHPCRDTVIRFKEKSLVKLPWGILRGQQRFVEGGGRGGRSFRAGQKKGRHPASGMPPLKINAVVYPQLPEQPPQPAAASSNLMLEEILNPV